MSFLFGSRSKSTTTSTSSDNNQQSSTTHERKFYVKIQPQLHLRPVDPSDPLSSIVYVNDDFHPILIHNEHFTGHAVFRVEHHSGHTPTNSADGRPKPVISRSEYFDDRQRKFSLQIEGRFRQEWSGDDILFGAFLDKPISVPTAAGVGLKLAKVIDPGLFGDLHASKPYLCSPLLVGMNVIGMRPAPKEAKESSADTAIFSMDEMPGSVRSMSPIESLLQLSKNSNNHGTSHGHGHNRINAIRRTASYCSSFDEAYYNGGSGGINNPRAAAINNLPQGNTNYSRGENNKEREKEREQLELRMARLALQSDLKDFVATSTLSSKRGNGNGNGNADQQEESEELAKPLLLPEWCWGGSRYLLENLLEDSSASASTSHAPNGHHSSPTAIHRVSSAPLVNHSDGSDSPSQDAELAHLERTAILRSSKDAAKKRRKHFNDAENRKSFTFSPDNCYSFEFTSSYADLNKFTINLGFSFDIEKYIRQPLVYEARNRTGDVVFFRIELGMM